MVVFPSDQWWVTDAVITASGSPAVGQWGARKNNGGGGLSVADGQAASAQIAEILWAVGGPLVKPSADLWGFVRWATTNPPTTAAAGSGSSVDSRQYLVAHC